MTLKELLDEQEKTFYEKFEYGHERPSLVGKGDAVIFLRQSNIETVKWVIKFIYKTTPEDSIETQRLDKNLLDDKYFIAGHDAAINDLVCELNKSIEDHA